MWRVCSLVPFCQEKSEYTPKKHIKNHRILTKKEYTPKKASKFGVCYMFFRLRHFSHKHSFFLFGPRGTGKSTLIKKRFDKNKCLWLDLLDSTIEDQFFRNPSNQIDIRAFSKITKDIDNCEAIVLSQDRFMKKFDRVTCYPWKQGLVEYFPELKTVDS
jgi:hypothetical protein